MRYSVFSVSLPEYDPEESLKVLKELGYEGIEWRVTEPVPKDPAKEVPFEMRYWGDNKSTIALSAIEQKAEELKELSDKYGIQIISLTTYLKPEQLDEIESVMRAAAKIGVKKMRVFQNGYPDKENPKNYRVAINDCRSCLTKIELMAKKYGVKVLLEIHHDTLISSPSAAYNILSGFDPNYIGLILDPGNMVYEGFESYQKMFELLGSYVGHIHVKNSALIEDGRDENGSKKWKRVWAPLWDGMADLKEVFRVMKLFGYDDFVSVEDFSNEQSTYDKLKANLEYLKKLEASV